MCHRSLIASNLQWHNFWLALDGHGLLQLCSVMEYHVQLHKLAVLTLHIKCTCTLCINFEVPCSMTCGNTALVHCSSLVWDVVCSVRDKVEQGRTRLVLVFWDKGMCMSEYVYLYMWLTWHYLPDKQGTVVWKALAVESWWTSVITHYAFERA